MYPPMNLKPGSDLMAKIILRDPKAMDFIIEPLTGAEYDYFIGNREWNNDTRSDRVLEPKSALSQTSLP